MKKAINNGVLLADFSKDYNVFRNVYSVLFPLMGFFFLNVFTIYFGKYLGYTSEDLSWVPLISSEKVPFEGDVMGVFGAIMTLILGLFFIIMGMIYLFRGKISWVSYDPISQELISTWNGLLKKERRIPIENIKYLRKRLAKNLRVTLVPDSIM